MFFISVFSLGFEEQYCGRGGAHSPWLFLLVAVLERFEGKEGSTPGKGSDNVFVAAQNVKGAAYVRAGLEIR